MEKRTIIDRIEIDPQTGIVGVRMLKQIIDDDGKTVLASEYHRTTITASADPAAQIAAVNTDLSRKGFATAKVEDVAVLNSALAPLASLRSTKAQEAQAVAVVAVK